MCRSIRLNLAPAVVALLATWAVPGCDSTHVPEPASPTVGADSEAGKKALAEDEKLHKERQEREAKARRRAPSLPAEG